MVSYRTTILANGQIYHVFNRGIDSRPTFTDKREYSRALLAADFYRFHKPSLSLSRALLLNLQERDIFISNLRREGEKIVKVVSYCFMPNHFHFLLEQTSDGGVSRFVNNFTNSYTRYFDTRNKRVGPLFQGVFKATMIENVEQLIHVSRYIHINPVVSYIVREEELDSYPWSSLPEYLGRTESEVCDKSVVLGLFSSPEDYRLFVHNQVDYGRELEAIKHLVMED